MIILLSDEVVMFYDLDLMNVVTDLNKVLSNDTGAVILSLNNIDLMGDGHAYVFFMFVELF